jgi:hypothetical protein
MCIYNIYIYTHLPPGGATRKIGSGFFKKNVFSPKKKMFGLDAKTETPEPTFKRIDTGVSENWF